MKKTFILLLIFLGVVAGAVLIYFYYFVEKSGSLSQSNEDILGVSIENVSGSVDDFQSSSSSFENEFYHDLEDLFSSSSSFYEDVQGDFGFTQS